MCGGNIVCRQKAILACYHSMKLEEMYVFVPNVRVL